MKTQVESEAGRAEKHTEIVELLPWYVNGTLDASGRREVDAHLAVCAECRAELSVVRQTEQRVSTQPRAAWQPSAAHFAGIMAKVDALEAAEPVTSPRREPRPAALRESFFQRVWRWLAQTPEPLRWTLGLETLALACLLAVLILPGQALWMGGRGDSFQTLSNAVSGAAGPETRIHLMLSETMTLAELRDLLKRAGGRLQDGPSSVGAYTIVVAPEQEVFALELLRQDRNVKLAEPVHDEP